jgi:multidrug transporter EmrE-like cation transporter
MAQAVSKFIFKQPATSREIIGIVLVVIGVVLLVSGI